MSHRDWRGTLIDVLGPEGFVLSPTDGFFGLARGNQRVDVFTWAEQKVIVQISPGRTRTETSYEGLRDHLILNVLPEVNRSY